MMKKLLLMAALWAAAVTSASAASRLVVNKGAADEQAFEFASMSAVNFTGTGLEFLSQESVTVPFCRISTIHFSTPTALAQVEVTRPQIHATSDALTIYGMEPGVTVEVYAVTGNRVLTVGAYRGETINISALAHGVYIVKAGAHTFKFAK